MGYMDAGQVTRLDDVLSVPDVDGLRDEGIRGLHARVLLAQARVTAALDPEHAEQLFFEAAYRAEVQGIADAKAGIGAPPVMFAGEELYLLQRWRWGFHFELECEEMRDCPGCNDGSGNPCPTHG